MARKHRKHSTVKRAIIGAVSAAALGVGALATSLASPASAAEWPTPSGQEGVGETRVVSGEFDGGMTRFYGEGDLGGGGQGEDQGAIFELEDGATLKNVILGSPAADGVHCEGSCTLENVWWEDVGEDAATFRGGDGSRFTVTGGGARQAEDKVLQHNGGGTLTVSGFAVEDFGALYRSCGNCSSQYERHVVFNDVEVTAPGDRLAGVNVNYGDTAEFNDITIIGDDDREIEPCVKYEGNDSGDEPDEIGSGPDGTNCLYEESDITYQ